MTVLLRIDNDGNEWDDFRGEWIYPPGSSERTWAQNMEPGTPPSASPSGGEAVDMTFDIKTDVFGGFGLSYQLWGTRKEFATPGAREIYGQFEIYCVDALAGVSSVLGFWDANSGPEQAGNTYTTTGNPPIGVWFSWSTANNRVVCGMRDFLNGHSTGFGHSVLEGNWGVLDFHIVLGDTSGALMEIRKDCGSIISLDRRDGLGGPHRIPDLDFCGLENGGGRYWFDKLVVRDEFVGDWICVVPEETVNRAGWGVLAS